MDKDQVKKDKATVNSNKKVEKKDKKVVAKKKVPSTSTDSANKPPKK